MCFVFIFVIKTAMAMALISLSSCEAPFGYVSIDGDCDDTDMVLNPSDADRDGVSSCDGDCNDNDTHLSRAIEVCDER